MKSSLPLFVISDVLLEILYQIRLANNFGEHKVIELSNRVLVMAQAYIISIEVYLDDPDVIVTQFACTSTKHFTQESVSIHDPNMVDMIKTHIINGLAAVQLFNKTA